jgi:hypothetical protein
MAVRKNEMTMMRQPQLGRQTTIRSTNKKIRSTNKKKRRPKAYTKLTRFRLCARRRYVANSAPLKHSADRCPIATHAGTGHHSCDLRSPRRLQRKTTIDAPLSAPPIEPPLRCCSGCNRSANINGCPSSRDDWRSHCGSSGRGPRDCRQDGDQSDGGRGVVAAAALPARRRRDALARRRRGWEASRCMNITSAGLL